MARVYVRQFELLSEEDEILFFSKLKRTCYQGVYPYKLFPDKELQTIDFAPLTIF